MRRRLALLSAFLLLGLTACDGAAPREPRVSDDGCVTAGRLQKASLHASSVMPFGARLMATKLWFETTAISARAADVPVRPDFAPDLTRELRAQPERTIKGDVPGEVRFLVAEETEAAIRDLLDDGGRLLVGLNIREREPLFHAEWLIGVPPAGTVEILNPCEGEHSETFLFAFTSRKRARGDERSAADILRSVLTGAGADYEAFKRFEIPRPRVAWADLPPEKRRMDEAPGPVLKGLKEVGFFVDIPPEWRDFELMFCSLNSFGWNRCMRWSAQADNQPVPVNVKLDPARRVEIWLTDQEDDPLHHTYGRVFTFTWPADATRIVYLEPTRDFASREEVIAAAERNETFLRVKR